MKERKDSKILDITNLPCCRQMRREARNRTRIHTRLSLLQDGYLIATCLKGRPLGQVNTRSWRNALQRAGIKNFRWHDLRHVWATWHVMAGTTIAELQELGAWKSELMVKRYAHFAPEQLRSAATRLGTFFGHTWVRGERGGTHNVLIDLAPRPGLEPGTCGLTVRPVIARKAAPVIAKAELVPQRGKLGKPAANITGCFGQDRCITGLSPPAISPPRRFLLPEAANAGRYPAENYVRIRRNVAGEYPVCRRKADARWLGLLNPTC